MTDDMEERRRLAKIFIDVSDPSLADQLRSMEASMRTHPATKAQADFLGTALNTIDMGKLEDILVDMTAQTFTAEELQLQIDFKISAAGKSIQRKMPEYAAATITTIGLYVQEAMLNAALSPDEDETSENKAGPKFN